VPPARGPKATARMTTAALLGGGWMYFEDGGNPFLRACHLGFGPAAAKVEGEYYICKSEFSDLCIAEPALATRRARDGNGPLFIAADAGHADVMQLLLKHGADPRSAMASGDTPLHRAVAQLCRDSGCGAAVRCLLAVLEEKDLTVANKRRRSACDLLTTHCRLRGGDGIPTDILARFGLIAVSCATLPADEATVQETGDSLENTLEASAAATREQVELVAESQTSSEACKSLQQCIPPESPATTMAPAVPTARVPGEPTGPEDQYLTQAHTADASPRPVETPLPYLEGAKKRAAEAAESPMVRGAARLQEHATEAALSSIGTPRETQATFKEVAVETPLVTYDESPMGSRGLGSDGSQAADPRVVGGPSLDATPEELTHKAITAKSDKSFPHWQSGAPKADALRARPESRPPSILTVLPGWGHHQMDSPMAENAPLCPELIGCTSSLEVLLTRLPSKMKGVRLLLVARYPTVGDIAATTPAALRMLGLTSKSAHALARLCKGIAKPMASPMPMGPSPSHQLQPPVALLTRSVYTSPFETGQGPSPASILKRKRLDGNVQEKKKVAFSFEEGHPELDR